MKTLRIKKYLFPLLVCSGIICCGFSICGAGCREPSVQPIPPYEFRLHYIFATDIEFNRASVNFHIITPSYIINQNEFTSGIDQWYTGSAYTSTRHIDYLGTTSTGKSLFSLSFHDVWLDPCQTHSVYHGFRTYRPYVVIEHRLTNRYCSNPLHRDGDQDLREDTLMIAVPEVDPIYDHPVYGRALRFYNDCPDVRAEIIEARAAVSPIELPWDSLFVGNTALEALTFNDLVPSFTIIEADDSLDVDVDETTPVNNSDFVYLVMSCDNPDDTAGTVEIVFKVFPRTTPTPALNEWGLIILAILLFGLMIFVVNRRRRRSQTIAA